MIIGINLVILFWYEYIWMTNDIFIDNLMQLVLGVHVSIISCPLFIQCQFYII